jgi:poly(A) polymerase
LRSALKDIALKNNLKSYATRKVEPQDWMVSHETKTVMDALSETGMVTALFVGGCVRNMLVGEEVGDIDIACVFDPDQVADRLTRRGIKVVPTGIEHGTVTAVVNKKPYEITTLRKDVETDGRRAVVKFSTDWGEDAERRDFTINTLLADSQGNVYDPTGQGLKDIDARVVRFVGDPTTRIAEDHLRILRFFRFHARYGKGAPDAEGLEACRYGADKIEELSRERITQEFFKILSVDKPADILSIMFDNSILTEFKFPEYDPKLMEHVCEFQRRFGLGFTAARLFVLAGLKQTNVTVTEKLLLIPKIFKKDIEAISEVLNLPDLKDDHAVREAVYRHGRVPTAQALMIELAQDRLMNGYANQALKIIQKWDIPQLPVTGNDLMKAGVEEGPELGRKLTEIEDWWVENDFAPGKKECLARV